MRKLAAIAERTGSLMVVARDTASKLEQAAAIFDRVMDAKRPAREFMRGDLAVVVDNRLERGTYQLWQHRESMPMLRAVPLQFEAQPFGLPPAM